MMASNLDSLVFITKRFLQLVDKKYPVSDNIIFCLFGYKTKKYEFSDKYKFPYNYFL